MPVERLNPPGLAEPQAYTHVGIASGSRLVFLAGQVALDADGELVGADDLAAQTEQALLNVGTCLEAAGASFDDVTKTLLYVVDWNEAKMEQLVTGLGRAAARLGVIPLSPTTMVPVPRLASDGLLVEIDVTAVVD